jgi:hypothetical protein
MYLMTSQGQVAVDGGPDGGYALFGVTTNLAEAGVAGWLAPPPFTAWTVLSASVASSTGDLVIDAIGGGTDAGFTYAATIPVSDLAPGPSGRGLVVGSSVFTAIPAPPNAAALSYWTNQSKAVSTNNHLVEWGAPAGASAWPGSLPTDTSSSTPRSPWGRNPASRSGGRRR